MFKKVDPRQNFPEMEKNMLDFWKKNRIFEKSMEDGEKPAFSFFDGPPFATGLPHYGHVVASLIKDVVPRYWTMKGRHVDRRWGWDCHGLPVENLIEKELGIENKQAIEEMGIDRFNAACCGAVLRYTDEWKEFIPRVGRWVNMENDYKTMNWQYTESIWWVFSEVYKKGLVYEGYKAMQMCPRCETTLANFEVTQGYKDITDLSATVKFKLTKESAEKLSKKYELEMRSHSDSAFLVGNEDLSQSEIYMLAWTTTPWTLPGNVALAVGEDVEYVIVKDKWVPGPDEILNSQDDLKRKNKEFITKYYIIARNSLDKFADNFRNHSPRVWSLNSSDLIGLSYEPLFSYYANKEDLKNRENGWKVYAADFVTTEEGVGIVHIAPAFGEDDMNLAHEFNLPFAQHVSRSGRFIDFLSSIPEEDKAYFVDKDGKGREVKPKRNPRETDEKMVEYLKKENKLFASENYKHSYPHCWRCDTPLLNYAASSWFVEVTKVRDRLVANNKEVNWVPEYIKYGRFGKWLEDARDWAVSRSRFWGAPIPIWKCEDCKEAEAIGSIDELRAKTDRKITKLIFARHGQAESNILKIRSDAEDAYPLTEEGKSQAEALGDKLKDAKIDIILSSPVLRAAETAEIVAKKLNVPFVKEKALKDYTFGSWSGFTTEELLRDNEMYREYKNLPDEERYNFRFGGDGESKADVENRVRGFLQEANSKYAGKNILVISHGIVGIALHRILNETSIKDALKLELGISNAVPTTYYIDEDGKRLDLHKPWIDQIEIKCPKCGKNMKIVGDVFDCWFESGSMPYAQIHYPFENQDKFQKSFPADFIAEGIDQTRGWFYTLMVLSTILFDKPAFKNVIVNGIVLAEDGQKMSKKLKNYPDPNLILEKYGADSLRYYLLTSPVMKAENLRFSEKGVDEVLKRFILTLWNTYSFLVMNIELGKVEKDSITNLQKSENLLDRWILSELNLLVAEVDREMQNYDLVKASRPLREFIDKLSNWYLRRSRKRFTSDDFADRLSAYQTLHFVLVTFTKVMAPFMPFLADEIFRNLTDKKSVHLEEFPAANPEDIDEELSKQMNLIREVVTLGLAARAQNRVKVRMPLQKIEIYKEGLANLDERLIEILKDELNVKEAVVAGSIKEENVSGSSVSGIRIALDFTITEELELEGLAREVVRQIQSMRKEAKYNRDDKIDVFYKITETGGKFERMLEKWLNEIKEECLIENFVSREEISENEADKIQEFAFENEKIILGVLGHK